MIDVNTEDITRIQEIVLNQLNRLDNDELMKDNGKPEIQRGNAISKNASSFVQLINTKLKVIEYKEKHNRGN